MQGLHLETPVASLEFIDNMDLTKSTLSFFGYGVFTCTSTTAQWSWYKIASANTLSEVERERFDNICYEKTPTGGKVIVDCSITPITTPTPTPIVPGSTDNTLKGWQMATIIAVAIIIFVSVFCTIICS